MKQRKAFQISLYYSTLLLLLLLSCKKDNNNKSESQESTISSRSVFKDLNEFITTAKKIEQMKDNDLMSWEDRNNKASLRSVLYSKPIDYEFTEEEYKLLDFPKSYLSILNKDAEVQIGDSIIWYHDGSKYIA